MKRCIITYLIIGMCGNFTAMSQSKTIDSLSALLAQAKEDTNKVNLSLKLSDQLEGSAPDKAIAYCRQAYSISKKMGFEKGIITSSRNMAYIFAFQSKFDSMLYYNKLVYDIAVKNKDTFNIGVSLFNMGEAYKYMADYEKGIDYTLRGVHMLEGRGYTNVEANLYAGLQSTYYQLKQYDKSIEHGLKGITLARKLDNKVPLMGLLANMGHCYNDVKEFDKAERSYNEAIPLARANKQKFIEASCYGGKIDIALNKKRYADIKVYAERSLSLNTEIENFYGLFGAHHNLGIYYSLMNDFPNADMHANTSLVIAKENNLLEMEAKAFALLATIAAAKHEIPAAIEYGNQSEQITNKIFTETVAQKDAEMRVKYETEKKESHIKLQQASIRQKNTLNYILIGSAITLLLIIVLSYRNYQHRQQLQQQRITELETQQQLSATEAVLKGESQERTRLAKDLHDGLGGMLSGIKYSLNTMKGNLIMTPENAQAFERSIDMLDSSIQEMRRVAHNMMPEALVKFGLDTALRDFCLHISQSGALKVSYQSIGFSEIQLGQTVAVTIYRIVQELLNNIIKHAGAQTAIVQLSVTNHTLSVTVEDDGIGFDTSALKQSAGIGWSNIENRIIFLNGKLDIQSVNNKGTSVWIELPLSGL